jgi:hypothetical protein
MIWLQIRRAVFWIRFSAISTPCADLRSTSAIETAMTLVSGTLSRGSPAVPSSVAVGHAEPCATMAARAPLLSCLSSSVSVLEALACGGDALLCREVETGERHLGRARGRIEGWLICHCSYRDCETRHDQASRADCGFKVGAAKRDRFSVHVNTPSTE